MSIPIPKMDEQFNIKDTIRIDKNFYKVKSIGADRMVLKLTEGKNNCFCSGDKVEINKYYYVVTCVNDEILSLRYLEYQKDISK